jgi:ubiquitin carboxyl-terminal hydrolase 48
MVRDSTVPVGLKNLGATCYLNAFLQTWFNINRFRAGVYQIPVRDSNSPIYQLQLLFGHLQNGLQKYYTPRPFVESMGLVETEQQDANEFYRLFIGLLENQIEDFRRGGHADVVNFVSDLLGGVYAHSTQCQNCHTKSTRPEVFSQFELHIKDKITLGQCLQDYLREEVLDGANQYFCSVCKSKQDALRFTELRKLPLLLNFQLMRFVIDMQSENFHKKKTNHLVKFPLSIDMREFLADGCADPQESYVYDLKSVLLHRGESAYRGHYMAHVYDQE